MKVGKLRSGFTIVELLIVIVVIGILAAITIVAYNGIQNRAKTASAQQAVAQGVKKVQTYYVTNSDTFPADLAAAGLSNSGQTSYQYSVDNNASPKKFCITATTQNISYFQNNTTQLTPALGACPGHGANGVATITNLVTNPALISSSTTYNSAGAVSSPGRYPVSDLAGFSSAYRATTSATTDRVYTVGAGLTIGTTYTASAWVKLTNGLSMTFQAADNTGAAYATTSSTPSTGGWQRLSITFTPTTATWRISARQAVAGAGQIWMTGVMITEGSTDYSYADGNTTNWVWNGADGLSTSTGPPPL